MSLAALAFGALAVPTHVQALEIDASVAVGGILWWDENGNGVRDQRDHPLSGAELDYSWGAATGRLSTAADGRYSIDLPAHVPFSVCVASFGRNAPQDMGIVPIVKDAGADDAHDSDAGFDNCVRGVSPRYGAQHTYDAGFRGVGPVSVGDRVWLDGDADGAQDPGEASLPGVTVTLKDRAHQVLGTTVTGSDGTYRLREFTDDEDVPPGVIEIEPDREYELCFDASTATGALPPGATTTDLRPTTRRAGEDEVDSDIGTDGCVSVNTAGDGEDLTVDAGFTTAAVVAATVQGFAWFDVNVDGLQGPGELPLAGLTVTLSGTPVTTDDDGIYIFRGQQPGTSSEICFDPSTVTNLPSPLVAGLRPTGANLGDDDMMDSDVIAPCFEISTPGQGSTLATDAGFGFAATSPPAAPGGVGDFVWLDADRDGTQDPDEPPLASVRVTLKGPAGVSLIGTTTDSSGAYHIDALLPDWDFALCFDATTATDLPYGLIAEDLLPAASDAGDDDAMDSDVDDSGCVEVATPAEGEDLTIDAGFLPRGPALALEKTAGEPADADDNGHIDAGDEVGYGYEVSNIGTVPLRDIEVTEDRVASVSCPELVLDPGETITCVAAYKVADADLFIGEIVNIAVAYGTGPTGQVVESNKDTATIAVNRSRTTGPVALTSVHASPGARLVAIAFYGDDSSPDIGIGIASALGGTIVLLTGVASLMLLHRGRRSTKY